MNKRNLVLSAAVSAALVGFAGVAQAGSITAPAAPVKYAVEAITATTDITLPNVVYTMGVARTTVQDFTIIYTLPAGTLFQATPAAPVSALFTATLKRGGAGTNQVVYDIDVTATAGIAVGDTITLVAPVLDNSTLGTVGNSVAMSVDLWETGETARVDNLTALSATVATGATAASLTTTACDAGTTTNVNATIPLAGFLAGADASADDTATIAKCTTLTAANTTAGVRNPTNAADYTLVAGDVVTLTVTDPTGFLGLAANGLFWDIDNGDDNDANETFTVSGNNATRIVAGDIFTGAHKVQYTSDATTPMGTARVLSVAGAIAPAVGTAASLGSNSAWWTWTSNGTVLQSPWFSTFGGGYTNRFVLMNTGSTAATYAATVQAEAGNTVTMGSAQGGTIPAGGQLVVNASDVATFSGNSRGTVSFTLNAPASQVKGTFQQVNPNTASVTNVPLERVYSGAQF